MINNFYKKGITIVEVLTVLAIIAILSLIVFPSFNAMKQQNVLKSSVSDVFSSLDKARSETLASISSSEYGVHFQSDKVIIFKGKVFSAIDPNNETISITPPVTISFSLGGASDLYYNRLTGAPSANGTITLSVTGNGSLTKIITISATGAVSQN